MILHVKAVDAHPMQEMAGLRWTGSEIVRVRLHTSLRITKLVRCRTRLRHTSLCGAGQCSGTPTCELVWVEARPLNKAQQKHSAMRTINSSKQNVLCLRTRRRAGACPNVRSRNRFQEFGSCSLGPCREFATGPRTCGS